MQTGKNVCLLELYDTSKYVEKEKPRHGGDDFFLCVSYSYVSGMRNIFGLFEVALDTDTRIM